MKPISAILGCALLAILPGVSQAKIDGTKADIARGQELCIVENPAGDSKFTTAFIRQVHAHGYPARFVKASSECTVSVTYSAVYAISGGDRRVLKTSTINVQRDNAILAVVTFQFSKYPGQLPVEEVIRKMLVVLLP